MVTHWLSCVWYMIVDLDDPNDLWLKLWDDFNKEYVYLPTQWLPPMDSQ